MVIVCRRIPLGCMPISDWIPFSSPIQSNVSGRTLSNSKANALPRRSTNSCRRLTSKRVRRHPCRLSIALCSSCCYSCHKLPLHSLFIINSMFFCHWLLLLIFLGKQQTAGLCKEVSINRWDRVFRCYRRYRGVNWSIYRLHIWREQCRKERSERWTGQWSRPTQW